jgi:hypothetical protein
MAARAERDLMASIMRARWWHEPLIGILALWAFTVIAPDLYRVFSDLPKLGFEADNDGDIFRVTDRVKDVLKDCTSIDLKTTKPADRLAIFGGMAGMQYVRQDLPEVHFYAFCQHPDVPQPERITIKPAPEKATLLNRFLLLAQELVGFLFISVGTILVWRHRSAASWGFFLFSIWFNPGQNFVLYAELQRWPAALLLQEGIQAVLQAAGYLGLVIFALKFPKDTTEPNRRWFERAAHHIGGIAAIFQLGFQLWSFATAFGYQTEIPTRISFLIGYGIQVLVIVILARKRSILSGENRAKLRWVFVGCLVGLPAYILADICASTSMLARWWQPPEELVSFLYLCNGLLAYAVFTAIWRNHLVDVKYILGRRLILILTWGATSAVLVAVAAQAEHLLEGISSREQAEGTSDTVITITKFLIYVAGLVLIKVVMDWVIDRLNEGLDFLFFRKRYDAHKELRALIASFEMNAREIEWIDRQVIHSAAGHLSLTWAAMFRRHPDETFQVVHAYCDLSESIEYPGPSRLLIEDLSKRPVWKRIADRPEMVDGAAEGANLASLAIPITLEGRLFSILLYGLHSGGDDIDKSERRLLMELAHAATRAYHRVEIARLRETIAKLDSQVQELCAQKQELVAKLAARATE